MSAASQNSFGCLNETQILRQIIRHSYEDFIPVRSATADLDSFELMSIVKCKQKRKQKSGFISNAIPWLSFLWKGSNKDNLAGHHLHPAEVFDSAYPSTAAGERPASPTKIGEQKFVFNIHNTSELNANCRPAPILDQVPALSLKLKTDTAAPSVDFGDIYESKVKRSYIQQWLRDHEKAINQEELKHLFRTSDLFIIYHVLYSEKMVIKHGSQSREESVTAGPISASAKFETQSSDETVSTIRPADLGMKPIAFKVARLNVVSKSSWYELDDVKILSLAPQKPSSLQPAHAFPGADNSDDDPGKLDIRSLLLFFFCMCVVLWIDFAAKQQASRRSGHVWTGLERYNHGKMSWDRTF